MPNIGNRESPMRNEEGYLDKTAYKAIKKIEAASSEESERFHKLLYTLRDVCSLAGFSIEGRITLVDNETGRIWR